MKKFLCFLLALCAVLPFSILCVFAETSSGEDLLKELATLKIDGQEFSLDDYPKDNTDTNLYLITAAERNFRSASDSPGYSFELYFYNPAGIEITDSTVNGLSASFDMDDENYLFYQLMLISKTEDNLFLKFRVAKHIDKTSYSDFLLKHKDPTESRVYNLVQVRLVVRGVLRKYDIAKAYVFAGYDFNNTLTCRADDLEVIKTTLHSSVWRSQYNIGDPYTFEQIATAYFTIPREYITKYGELFSLKATFDEYRSTPIIVTNSADFNSRTNVVSALQSGGAAPDGFRMYYGYLRSFIMGTSAVGVSYDWLYGVDPDASSYALYSVNEQCNSIFYYFYSPQLSFVGSGDDKKLYSAVSSADFAKYVSAHSGGSKVTVNPNLYESSKSYQSLETSKDEVYEKLTQTYREGNWFQRLIGKKYIETSSGSVKIEKIQVIDNPSDYVYATASQMEALYLNYNDVDEFQDVCQEAVDNDCIVVCYHFAESDYEVHELGVSPKLGDKDEDHSVWMAQQTFYYNFSVLSATFHRDGESHTVPVSSTSINVIGGVDATKPASPLLPEFPDFDDFKEKALQILKIVGFVLIAVAVIWLLVKFVVPLLSPIISAIVTVVTAPFKAISKRRKQKNDRKNE